MSTGVRSQVRKERFPEVANSINYIKSIEWVLLFKILLLCATLKCFFPLNFRPSVTLS